MPIQAMTSLAKTEDSAGFKQTPLRLITPRT